MLYFINFKLFRETSKEFLEKVLAKINFLEKSLNKNDYDN